MAVAGLALAAAQPLATSLGASPSAARKGTEPATYYLSRPCALVPQAEVKKALQAPMRPGQPKPGNTVSSCTFITTGSDMYAEFSYALRPGTAASVRSHFTGTYFDEHAVAGGAYCVVGMANEAAFEANIGTLRGRRYHLDMSAQTCAYAAKLAKYALSRL